MERPVSKMLHDDLYGNAVLRDTEFYGKRINHRARHIECFRYLFSPSTLFRLQMIEHSDAHGESAVFLYNVRM